MAEITDTSFVMLLETEVVSKVGKVGGFVIGEDNYGEELGGI